MKHNPLNGIPGEKIRKQYFGFPLYISFFTAYFLILTAIFLPFFGDRFTFADSLTALYVIPIPFILSSPFMLLSFLNRRYFGKVVCVLDGNGLHYKDGFIAWQDIATYEYSFSHKTTPSFLTITAKVKGKHKKIQYETAYIYSAPRYMMLKIKRYAPHAKKKLDWDILIVAIGVLICYILAVSFIRST